MNLKGHYYTIWPSVRHDWLPERAPAAKPFEVAVPDPVRGSVRLTGLLTEVPDADTILIVIHGLGGHPDRFYGRRAARAAAARGWSCLRFAMRGADLSGEDFYHTALSGDVAAVVGAPELARYERVHVIGYSIGGHLALHYGVDVDDRRVGAIAAICAPLDLKKSCAYIDGPRAWFYRRHVLAGLKRMYAACAEKGEVPSPLAEVRRAPTFRVWDSLTVVPRFGFDSVDHYYETASVAPRLAGLRRPALFVGEHQDPVTPPSTQREALEGSPKPPVDVRWLRHGGHVGFPRDLDLGEAGPPGLEGQALAWLDSAGR